MNHVYSEKTGDLAHVSFDADLVGGFSGFESSEKLVFVLGDDGNAHVVFQSTLALRAARSLSLSWVTMETHMLFSRALWVFFLHSAFIEV
uniref:Uncharacterized protein n=1 Tax=Panagrolaimus sp. JU765 TaxID=591449 RepID=A0AC34QYJ0_9BILA